MSVFVTDNALLSVLLLLGKPGAQLSTGGIDVFAHFPADGGIDFMFLQTFKNASTTFFDGRSKPFSGTGLAGIKLTLACLNRK